MARPSSKLVSRTSVDWVVRPDDHVFAAFESLARPLYQRIVSNERESRSLATLRDTLLPKTAIGRGSSERFRTISRKGRLMAEINLTQTEADAWIAMEKHRVNDERWYYPVLGESISVPLISADRRENFILDVSRGRINFAEGNLPESCSAGCRTRPLGLWWSPIGTQTAKSLGHLTFMCIERDTVTNGLYLFQARFPEYYGHMENT